MKRAFQILVIVLSLLLAALACNLNVGGPEVPDEPAPVSTEAAGDLVDTWKQAFETAKETGVVSLSLTEEQLTSYFALSMAKQEKPLLTNPRVILRDGEMEIVGTYDTGTIDANVGIVMEVTVDDSGVPKIEVTSGSIGPLPLPAELLTGVSEIMNQSLTGQLGTTATGFTMESITISDGVLTINGTLK